MVVNFSGDLTGRSTALPHFWEHTVGSGHATLALRADWQAQLRRAHDELGMAHVRFHGILSDDMSTLVREDGALLYSFFNADTIFDFLLSIGMKPFVELGFMPMALASGDRTVFHYRANVTQPRSHAQWAVTIRDLVGHWADRYGLDEVRQWYFEVWNEPNLTEFGNARQADYFELYRYTADAIKAVDRELKVGGPATAANAWVADFIRFCDANRLPADFISTHHYPNDACGQPGDDAETQLSKSPRSVLREQARTVRGQAGGRPVYYTEWCTSSKPRDPLHDEPYAAAFIVKTVLEASGLVQGYSYWTFSDIFEETYFPSAPFHGGFGLLNIHGIAKPSYRAFELLHALGTELMDVEGAHATVDAWLARGPIGGPIGGPAGQKTSATLILTNFALPRHRIGNETVRFALSGAGPRIEATIRRIDREHANPKRRWEQLGHPEYPNAEILTELHAVSCVTKEVQRIEYNDGIARLEVAMPPQSVASIEFAY